MPLNLFKPWLYYYCIFFRGRNGRWERVYVFLCSKLTTNRAHSYGLGLFSSSNGFFTLSLGICVIAETNKLEYPASTFAIWGVEISRRI